MAEHDEGPQIAPEALIQQEVTGYQAATRSRVTPGADNPLAISIGNRPGTDSTTWSNKTVTWGGFCDGLKEPADRKGCGSYVLGALADGKRNKKSVLSRSALTLDVDSPKADFLDRLEEFMTGRAYAWHTTYSSTAEAPRYRVIIPLVAALSPADYRAAAGEIMRRVSPDGGEFDTSSDEPERLMLKPSAQAGHKDAYRHGAPVGDWMDAAPYVEAGRPPAKVPEADPVLPTDGKPVDGKAYFLRAVNDEADLLAFHHEGDRNSGLNRAAFKLGQLAHLWLENSQEEPEDSAREKLLWACRENDFIENGEEGEFHRTFGNGWRDGLATPRDAKAAPVGEDSDIFQATPILQQIQQAAYCRVVSASALLAYVLVRVLAEVPPGTTLPPVVGSAASLNFAVAVVGRSGEGKSALHEVSRQMFGLEGAMQGEIERNVGSGEGLAQTFLHYNKTTRENELVEYPHRIITVDEIDQLGATQDRSGATIAPMLRTALTGGRLGQENAKAENIRRVAAGTYRLVMVVGVQPTRSGTLLNESDAGTPQRFLWVRATDRNMPDEPAPWPGPLDWEMPNLVGLDCIDYPDDVKAEIRAVRLVQVRGGGDPNDGHRMLTRLKVGAALALLHGGTFITHQWWELAGELVAASMRVQDECRSELAQETEMQRRNQGRQDGIRQAGAAEFRNERVTKAAEAIARTVRRHMEGTNEQKHAPNDGCTTRCLSKAVQNFHDIKGSPDLKDATVRHAEDAEWVQKREGRWIAGSSQPA
ncbi:hypothetical protein [Arthrobacter sp. L77]|uniref:hypothetical protein n=1 Tax=Arthrobacter sp. L77 TaxID=1496689 RepID=UPI0012E0A9F8|nr:hypothetical protein [Arthrobacter sp. L77]